MRTRHLTRMVVLLTVTALVVGLAAAAASARGARSSGRGGQIISVVGQSNSRPDLTVDIVMYVPAGQSVSAAAAAALESQNARPVSPSYLGSDGFSLNGGVWPGATTQAYHDVTSRTGPTPETGFHSVTSRMHRSSGPRFPGPAST